MIPSFGTRAYDDDGLVCHVCGRGYQALATHAIRTHGFTSADHYRQTFGLSNHGLLSHESRHRHRAHALAQNLAELGKPTRITQPPQEAPHLSTEGRQHANTNLLRGNLPALTAAHEKRRARTHCRQDHPYSDENTHWVTALSGRRYRRCRACGREAKKRARTSDSRPG